MTPSRTKALVLLGLGVMLLVALVWSAGPARMGQALQSADPLFLGLGLLTYAVFFLLRGLRWRILLAQGAPSTRLSSTTGITAIGWLANSILPLKGGDLLRAALLSKRERIGLATSASTIAVERVLDLLGLALVAAFGLLLVPREANLPAGLTRALELAWLAPLLGLGLLALMVRLRVPTLRLADATLGRMGNPGRRLAAFLDTVLSALLALARRPVLLARLLPLTLLVALAQALVFVFLARAFLPDLPLLLGFAGASLFLLSFVFSFTPGNIGTYEAAFAAVFVALGVPVGQAVSTGVLTHVTTTLIVAMLGSIGLLNLGIEARAVAWRPLRVPAQGGSP